MAVVVDVVADDLHPGHAERGDVAAEDVEVAAEGGVGDEVDPGLDHGFPAPLGPEPRLHRGEDLVVGHGEGVDVRAREVGEVDGRAHGPRILRGEAPWTADAANPVTQAQRWRDALSARAGKQ